VLLDKKVEIVILQFFLNSRQEIPAELAEKERACSGRRPQDRSGEATINYQQDCDISGFPEDLYRVGYRINDVCWQERKVGFVVRFFLLRKRTSRLKKGYFWDALASLASSGYWEVWAFQNSGKIKINFRGRRIPKEGEKFGSYLYIMNNVIQLEIF